MSENDGEYNPGSDPLVRPLSHPFKIEINVSLCLQKARKGTGVPKKKPRLSQPGKRAPYVRLLLPLLTVRQN